MGVGAGWSAAILLVQDCDGDGGAGVEPLGRQITTERRQFAATILRKSARWARLAGWREGDGLVVV
jgi:hypothetical protein